MIRQKQSSSFKIVYRSERYLLHGPDPSEARKIQYQDHPDLTVTEIRSPSGAISSKRHKSAKDNGVLKGCAILTLLWTLFCQSSALTRLLECIEVQYSLEE
jgi:hypothetical protein